MDGLLRDLTTNGFVIYPKDGQFVIEKVSVPGFATVIGPRQFDTYDAALAGAVAILEEHRGPKVQDFQVVVRYSRGLGVEYKNLPDIQAVTLEEAEQKATAEAERVLADPKLTIREVRVRPRV